MNVETTLDHWRWIDIILLILFQRCFVNVETTSINIRRLNFHFQPNFNVETTLVYWRWIDVILSTLFCQRWNNVDKCTSAQHSFSTKYQRWYVCWVVLVYWLLTLNIPHTWFLRFYCWLWTFKCFLVGDYLG